MYRYIFYQVMATPEAAVPDDDPGAAHATDIPFVFNVLEYTGNPISKGDRTTANLMVDYWTNFARSGNPKMGRGFLSGQFLEEKMETGLCD